MTTSATPATLGGAQPGVVHEGGGLRLVDLRELPWEPHMGIPGGLQQTLVRHPDGWSQVQVTWIPPGLKGGDRPERHFHRSVLERGIVLFGQLPMREYAGPDDRHGVPVLFREGFFMDRRPSSVHGIDPDQASATGFVMLEWRTGPGTFLWEDGAHEETIMLDAERRPGTRALKPDGAPPWVVVDSGGLTLLDTRAMPWEPHDGIPGASVRVLTRAPEGHTDTVILQLPPLPADLAAEPHRHFHRTVHELGYVLGGELPMREYASEDDDVGVRVRFHEGCFMDRAPGSVHGLDPSRATVPGFTFLEWRDGPGTYLHEAGMETETVVLPAARLDD